MLLFVAFYFEGADSKCRGCRSLRGQVHVRWDGVRCGVTVVTWHGSASRWGSQQAWTFFFMKEVTSSLSLCAAKSLSCLSGRCSVADRWPLSVSDNQREHSLTHSDSLCCRHGTVRLQWRCVHCGGLERDPGDRQEQEERGSFESRTIWDRL